MDQELGGRCATNIHSLKDASSHKMLECTSQVCSQGCDTRQSLAQVEELIAGEVGYLAASIKAVADARVGDTITMKKQPAQRALVGYQQVMPMVYCGLFPTDADQFEDLREALGRLQLNDAALQFEPEVTSSFGTCHWFVLHGCFCLTAACCCS